MLFVTYVRFSEEGRAIWRRRAPDLAAVFEEWRRGIINNVQAKERLQPLFKGKYNVRAKGRINGHSIEISIDEIYEAVMKMVTEEGGDEEMIPLFRYTMVNNRYCGQEGCNNGRPVLQVFVHNNRHILVPYHNDWTIETCIQRAMRGVTSATTCNQCHNRGVISQQEQQRIPAILIIGIPKPQHGMMAGQAILPETSSDRQDWYEFPVATNNPDTVDSLVYIKCRFEWLWIRLGNVGGLVNDTEKNSPAFSPLTSSLDR
jgi:hypothetical protein